MSASSALLLLALAAFPAEAQDLGEEVRFAAAGRTRFSVQAVAGSESIVYESGPSLPLATVWDTILIQGESPDAGVRFQAARQDPAGAWSPWADMVLERRSDGRFWGKVKLPRGGGALRLRALARGTSRHEVSLYAVEAYLEAPAPPTGMPAPAPETAGDPSTPRPLVHARAAWNATAPVDAYTPDPAPWRVTLHHTDGRRTTTLADSLAEAKFIQDFHMRGRGWNDIAYHFIADAAGNLIEGRPEGVQGAHTLANNEGNIGIVLLGTYHPPTNDAATTVQLDAVAELGRYLVRRYALDPFSLKGHRDYKKTSCPGDSAYPLLDGLRKAFAQTPTTVPGDSLRGPPTLPWWSAPAWDGRPGQR